MITIHKYVLPKEAPRVNTFKIPGLIGIMHFGLDPLGDLCLWVHTDTEAPVEEHHIGIYGTGMELPKPEPRYIGTQRCGEYMFHAFIVWKH